MSRAQRAELEKLQSELAAVRLAIRDTESRIPEARVHAQIAEEAWAAVKEPHDELGEENRALKEQIKWEHARAWRSFWSAFIAFMVVSMTLGATCCASSLAESVR